MNKTLLTEILIVVALAGVLLAQAVAASSTGPIDPVVVPVSDSLREHSFTASTGPAAEAYISIADALRESGAASKVAPAAYMSVADALRESEAASTTAPAAYLSVADTLRESKTAAGKPSPSLSDSLREPSARPTTHSAGVSASDQLRESAGVKDQRQDQD